MVRYFPEVFGVLVSAVIPSLGNKSLVKCVDALVRAVDEVIVVYDGVALPSLGPKIKMLARPKRMGSGKAINDGVALAKGRYTLVATEDVAPQPGCVERLLEVLQQHPPFGVVLAENSALFQCSLVDPEVWAQVGKLDESPEFRYGACDFDYYLRLVDAGFIPMKIEGARVEHLERRPVDRTPEQERRAVTRLLEKRGVSWQDMPQMATYNG